MPTKREVSAEQPVYVSASRLIPQCSLSVSPKKKNVSVVIHLLRSKAIEVKNQKKKATIHNLNSIKVRLLTRKMEEGKANKLPSDGRSR